MTNLEIILTVTIYLIIGLWICWKRDWYPHYEYKVMSIAVSFFATLYMPINLIIVIVKEFVIRKWNN